MEWLRRLNGACGSEDGKPKLMHGVEVTAAQARQIGEAIARMEASLRSGPGDLPAKGVVIARFLSAFPGSGEQGMRSDAYLEALENVPAWAVERAAGRFIRGEASVDARFAPTPPQVAQEARAAMQPARDDLAKLSRLRDAVADREAPPEERARVSAGFDNLLAEFGRKRNEQADALGALEQRCCDLGIDPAAIDAVPNQPESKQVGTWSKLPAQPERTEA
jgi:hypothetical protein